MVFCLINSEFDLEKRIRIGKEVDNIVCDVHPVSFGIKRLYRRFLFWDKFGFPEYMVDRFVGNSESVFFLWWFDPEKETRLKDAIQNDQQLSISDVDFKYWPKWNTENK